jgi:hypothetical protein
MPTLRADNKQALARTSDAKFPRSVLTFLHSLGITLAAAVAHLYSGKPSNPLVLSGTSFCGASGPWVLQISVGARFDSGGYYVVCSGCTRGRCVQMVGGI